MSFALDVAKKNQTVNTARYRRYSVIYIIIIVKYTVISFFFFFFFGLYHFLGIIHGKRTLGVFCLKKKSIIIIHRSNNVEKFLFDIKSHSINCK